MKKLYLAYPLLLLAGCISPQNGGNKRLFGVVPIPGMSTQPVAPETSEKIAIIHQLAPFHYVAILLILCGAAMCYFTTGNTKAGKFFIGLGLGLSTFAVVMPQIAGWIGLISIIFIVIASGFLLYDFIIKKQRKKQP